jgi:hypothetical protein
MKTLKKYALIYFIFICFFITSYSQTQDFSIHPEDNPFPDDFIEFSGEVFYNSYYFTSTNTVLNDQRNGVQIFPTFDVFFK